MLKDKIKTLASDTLTYGVFQILGRFLTALLTPLYSNYLSPTDNGTVAYLFSILIFAQFIYIFGMESAFFRFYSQNDDAKNKKVFTTAFVLITSLGFLFTAIFLIFSNSFSEMIIGNDTPSALYIFQIVCFIPLLDGLISIPAGRLRMQRKIKKFATLHLIFVILAVGLTSYFIMFTSLGVLGVFAAQLIVCLFKVAVFLPDILRMLDLKLDFLLFKDMLKFGVPTLPANISAIALQVADRPIMKLFITNAEIGIYQIVAKLALPMLLLVTVFDYAWKPFFLNHFNDDDAKKLFSRVLTYYILVASVVWLFVSLFIDYIVRIPLWDGRYFIHPDYWGGIGIATLIMLGYLINGMTTNFAAVFHIEKKTKYLPITIGFSALASIILNFILVPIIGSIGAAISLVIGYSIGAILMKTLHSKVNYKINYEWKRIIIIGFASVLTLFCGKFVTINFDLTIAFFIKLSIMFGYLLLLKLLGFFTAGELTQLKKIFKMQT